jgi:hypothetical protein
MKSDEKTIHVKVDTYTRLCLTVLAVLLTVVVLGLWATHTPAPDSARAAEPQIYGPTKQRASLIEEQKQTNQKLDALLKYLKSGQLKVQVKDDKDADVVPVGRPKKDTGGNDGKIIIRKTDR